jgi:tetratricopeptide (TPR) repeat protein/transcriptional regulator with XRE-family HTH domain
VPGRPDELAEPTAFAAAVRRWRLAARLTQEELAARSGLSARSVGDIERGRVRNPRRDSARLLANALGLSAGDRADFLALAKAAYWAQRADHPQDSAGSPQPPGAVPRQLPAEISGFVGRGEYLTELDLLAQPRSRGLSVVVISGTAGVGKTTLAVRWAHEAASRFPDGQLYANLRGFDPHGSAATPAEIVRDFLVALGVPSEKVPPSLEAQTALYRSLLADRRILILLDNAADADQVRPLLPGSGGCPVLVTSRDPLVGVVVAVDARPIELQLMPPTESRNLLRRRLGARLVEAEPTAVGEIAQLCGGLPLALAIAAARALARPHLPLSTTVTDLQLANTRLDSLRTGDDATDIRAVFHWSYRLLSEAAARLFRLLGTAPPPQVSETAAASLLGTPLDRTRSLLTELTKAHLLSEPATGRYACHDLLRSYAAELASTVDTEDDRRQALHRLLDHQLHTARVAALLLSRNRRLPELPPPQAGVLVHDPGDHDPAMAWFATEQAGLLAGLQRAAAEGFDLHAARLPTLLDTYLDRTGQWETLQAIDTVAIDAAEQLGDRRQLGFSRKDRSRALIRLGRYELAEADLRLAIEILSSVADDGGLADAYMDLGWLENLRGDADLRPLLEKAFALYRRSGNQVGEARTLANLGWIYFQRGEHDLALEYMTQALSLHREVGNRPSEANTEANLGRLHLAAGRHQKALESAQRALDLYSASGDRFYQADSLILLGDVHLALGETAAGRAAWTSALAILDELQHPLASQVRDRLRPVADAGSQ